MSGTYTGLGESIIALSVIKHVQTPEGSKKYHLPIGAPIVHDPAGKVITDVTKLKSLGHPFKTAEEMAAEAAPNKGKTISVADMYGYKLQPGESAYQQKPGSGVWVHSPDGVWSVLSPGGKKVVLAPPAQKLAAQMAPEYQHVKHNQTHESLPGEKTVGSAEKITGGVKVSNPEAKPAVESVKSAVKAVSEVKPEAPVKKNPTLTEHKLENHAQFEGIGEKVTSVEHMESLPAGSVITRKVSHSSKAIKEYVKKPDGKWHSTDNNSSLKASAFKNSIEDNRVRIGAFSVKKAENIEPKIQPVTPKLAEQTYVPKPEKAFVPSPVAPKEIVPPSVAHPQEVTWQEAQLQNVGSVITITGAQGYFALGNDGIYHSISGHSDFVVMPGFGFPALVYQGPNKEFPVAFPSVKQLEDMPQGSVVARSTSGVYSPYRKDHNGAWIALSGSQESHDSAWIHESVAEVLSTDFRDVTPENPLGLYNGDLIKGNLIQESLPEGTKITWLGHTLTKVSKPGSNLWTDGTKTADFPVMATKATLISMGSPQQIVPPVTGPPSNLTKDQILVGSVLVTKDQLTEAISILENSKGIMIKQPLAKVGNPLAGSDYHGAVAQPHKGYLALSYKDVHKTAKPAFIQYLKDTLAKADSSSTGNVVVSDGTSSGIFEKKIPEPTPVTEMPKSGSPSAPDYKAGDSVWGDTASVLPVGTVVSLNSEGIYTKELSSTGDPVWHSSEGYISESFLLTEDKLTVLGMDTSVGKIAPATVKPKVDISADSFKPTFHVGQVLEDPHYIPDLPEGTILGVVGFGTFKYVGDGEIQGVNPEANHASVGKPIFWAALVDDTDKIKILSIPGSEPTPQKAKALPFIGDSIEKSGLDNLPVGAKVQFNGQQILQKNDKGGWTEVTAGGVGIDDWNMDHAIMADKFIYQGQGKAIIVPPRPELKFGHKISDSLVWSDIPKGHVVWTPKSFSAKLVVANGDGTFTSLETGKPASTGAYFYKDASTYFGELSPAVQGLKYAHIYNAHIASHVSDGQILKDVLGGTYTYHGKNGVGSLETSTGLQIPLGAQEEVHSIGPLFATNLTAPKSAIEEMPSKVASFGSDLHKGDPVKYQSLGDFPDGTKLTYWGTTTEPQLGDKAVLEKIDGKWNWTSPNGSFPAAKFATDDLFQFESMPKSVPKGPIEPHAKGESLTSKNLSELPSGSVINIDLSNEGDWVHLKKIDAKNWEQITDSQDFKTGETWPSSVLEGENTKVEYVHGPTGHTPKSGGPSTQASPASSFDTKDPKVIKGAPTGTVLTTPSGSFFQKTGPDSWKMSDAPSKNVGDQFISMIAESPNSPLTHDTSGKLGFDVSAPEITVPQSNFPGISFDSTGAAIVSPEVSAVPPAYSLVSAASLKTDVEALSKAFQGSIGKHPTQLVKADKIQWINSVKQGDLAQAYKLEAAAALKKGKPVPGTEHPGHPDNPQTNKLILPAQVKGEIPAGISIPGTWSNSSSSASPQEIGNYLIVAKMAHPEQLSANELALWVIYHKLGNKKAVDKLSRIAEVRAENGTIPKSDKPEWTSNLAATLANEKISQAAANKALWENLLAGKKYDLSQWSGNAMSAYVDHLYFTGEISQDPVGLASYEKSAVVGKYLAQLKLDEANKAKIKVYTKLPGEKLTSQGFTPSYVVQDQHGNKYVFKEMRPGEKAWRTYTERGANDVGRMLGFNTVNGEVTKVEGKDGYIQPRADVVGDLALVDFSTLTPAQASGIAENMVLDHLIDNGDAHRNNFLIKPDGTIMGIDKATGFWPDKFGHVTLGSNGDAGKAIYGDFLKAMSIAPKDVRDKAYLTSLIRAQRAQSTSDGRLYDYIQKMIEDHHPGYASMSGVQKHDFVGKYTQAFLKRKNAVASDVQKLWEDVYKKAGDSLPEIKNDLPEGHHSSVSDPALLEKVSITGSHGQAVLLGGDALKHGHLLLWKEKHKNGEVITRAQSTLTEEAKTKLLHWADNYVVDNTGHSVELPQQSLLFNVLVEGAKGVSSSSAKGSIDSHDQGRIDKWSKLAVALPVLAQELQAELQTSDPASMQNGTKFFSLGKGTDFSVSVKAADAPLYLAMLNNYQQLSDKIKHAQETKGKTKKEDFQLKYTTPMLGSGVQAIYGPHGGYAGKDTDGKYFQLNHGKQTVLTQQEFEALANSPEWIGSTSSPDNNFTVQKISAFREAGTLDKNGDLILSGEALNTGNSGHMYRITYHDGTTIDFRDTDQSGTSTSQRGMIRFSAPSSPQDTGAHLDALLTKLKDLGLNIEEGNLTNQEVSYWRRYDAEMRSFKKDSYFNKYESAYNAALKDHGVTAEQLKTLAPDQQQAVWRSVFSKWQGEQKVQDWIDKQKFLPDYPASDHKNETSGVPAWNRLDAPSVAEMFDLAGMGAFPSSSLHSNYEDASALAIVESGAALSTEERIRVLGKFITGTSSSGDQGTGGANSVFTRLHRGSDKDVYYSPLASQRMGSFAFDFDGWGNTTKKTERSSSDLGVALSWGADAMNELCIPDSQSLMRDIEIMAFQTEAARKKALDLMYKRGIKKIRGLPVEARFVMKKDIKQALEKAKEALLSLHQ